MNLEHLSRLHGLVKDADCALHSEFGWTFEELADWTIEVNKCIASIFGHDNCKD